MPDLGRAVTTVVSRCLAVRGGEECVVVTDPATLDLGRALHDAAQVRGADAVLVVMEERDMDGQEPPAPVAAALAAADVFLAPTHRSLSHTRARKAATDAGARGATLPGVTADMLARVMDVDFDLLTRRSQAVAELLTREPEVRVRCPRGTDLSLDLSGRTGVSDDGDLTAPGAFGNLPCGEGFVAPAGGEGTFVVSCFARFGLPEEPVTLTIEDGALSGHDGSPLGQTFFDTLATHGPEGLNLAELGLGTNDRARMTGNILEDEKILGTVHVAFGASASFGGTVSVPIHLDALIADATLDVGATRVLDGGRFVLDA